MRRRGNKSSKVPNVKLRPADPSYSSRHQLEESPYNERYLVQDSQASGSEDASFGMCPRPFTGVVLCATGVDKTLIFKKAIELGAMVTSAFTDRVTHLVADDYGSEKYKVALERKIPILSMAWILESFDVWQRGDDVVLHECVERHRLPIFAGVNLSLSGFEDVHRRTQINKLLTRNGGVYTKDLKRPVTITHLLCTGDTETEKMHYSEKFNTRKEANIHLVWEEWFWDCLEFGGRFEEERYHVRRPRPQPRSSPPALRPSLQVTSTEPSIAGLPPATKPPIQSNQPVDEEDEMASTTRVAAVTQKFWASLLKPRGLELTSQGNVMVSPTRSQKPSQRERSTSPSPPERPLLSRKGTSILNKSSFRRANSFIQDRDAQPKLSRSRQPFRKVSSVAALGGGALDLVPDDGMPVAGPSHSTSKRELFKGLKFQIRGEARSASVRQAIEQGSGAIAPASDVDREEEVDFIIVRIVSGSKLYRTEPEEELRDKYRTECWLEQCLYEERIVNPDDHVSFRPLGIEIPIPDADRVRVSFSGLEMADRVFTQRLIRALGLNLAPTFSRQSTHLLCPTRTGAKYEKALEWGVPVVGMEWLVEMVRTARIPDVEVRERENELQMEVDMPLDKKGKGKAKEKEGGDVKMVEITNSQSLQDQAIVNDSPTASQSYFGPPVGLVIPEQQEQSSSPDRPPETQPSTPPPPPLPLPLHLPTRHSESELRQRIPSSQSPSPMKSAPASFSGSGSGRMSLSPQKVAPPPIAVEVTKKLQRDFTTLLGKRRSEDGAAGAGEGTKRARPGRGGSGSSSGLGSSSKPPAKDADAEDAFAGPEGSYTFESQQQSMRVMYEDPGQREEKRRLMNLIGGTKEGREKKKRGSRTGGF